MNFLRIVSLILLFFTAINALAAGYLFMADPSGALLGMSVTWLDHSPFSNFLVPGIVLFIVNGVMTALTAFFVLFRWKGWVSLVLVQGVLLTGWIISQVIMLQTFFWLHAVFAGIGIILMIAGLTLNPSGKNE